MYNEHIFGGFFCVAQSLSTIYIIGISRTYVIEQNQEIFHF